MSKQDTEFTGFEKFIYTAFAIGLLIFIGGFWVGHSSAENRYKQELIAQEHVEEIDKSTKIYVDSYRLSKRISTGHVASYEYWFDYTKDNELYNIQMSQLKVVDSKDGDYITLEDCDGADCHPLAAKGTKHVTLHGEEFTLNLYEKYDFRNILVE